MTIDERFDYLLEHPEETTAADKWAFRYEYMDLYDDADDYEGESYEED